MLDRIRKFLGGETPRQITNKRLIPDSTRVVAGFDFGVSSVQRGAADVAQAQKSAIRSELERQGTIKNTAGIPLDSPQLELLCKQLRKLQESGQFQCSGEFRFTLNPEADPGWEWFEVHPHTHSPVDFSAWACRADRMPPGQPWVDNNFLPERTKRIIEGAGLIGLEFTWVRDVGRYQAEQWYHAMATTPLGRGVDHPFFDPAKLTQPDYVKRWATFEEWRFGMSFLKKSEFIPTASFGVAALDNLLELFSPSSLELKGFRQVLRQFVPPFDFAYVWDFRLPLLCCNARARAVLVKNRILASSDFVPIWVWDEAPAGAIVLDCEGQKCVSPYPMPAGVWEVVQEKVRADRQKFTVSPKPKRVIDAAKVLKRFRASHPPKARAVSVLPQSVSVATSPKLPEFWDKLLGISEDFLLQANAASGEGVESYEVISRSELAEFQRMTEESARHFISDFPEHLTHFAHDGEGNWLSFDMKTLTPEGDCHVMKWRHDTLCAEQEWPSIVQLLEESLELAEKEDED
jgi:hypothetical protein